MGWFDGSSVVSSGGRSKRHSSRSHKRHRSRSRSRSKSRSRSRSRGRKAGSLASFLAGAPLGSSDKFYKQTSSRSSFFGLGNMSRGSLFGLGPFSRPSYYKRSSRPNFMRRAWKKLKRILRDLVHYAKRHPWKVFVLVIMPLITTGALAGLLARFGLRLPKSIERMMGIAAKAGSGDSIGLVGEAVKMASELGNNGTAGRSASHSSYESSRSYGRRGSDYRSDWSGSSSGGWGIDDGIKYVGKIFS